jgi:UDP-N-acetylmuramoyl-tripeptide--D-alanyl-D-alanine ligase
LAAGSADTVVTSVSNDTRAIVAGACFVAVLGERRDGHAFLKQAADKGAVALLVSDGTAASKLMDYSGAVLIVADTVKALGDLAAWYRRKLSSRVIGITGSCGKSSVKEMIGQVLSSKLKGHRAESSFNNFLGVPLTIFGGQPNDDYLIVEMGTNAPGEIRRLAEIAQPDVAVVTCVGPVHLEGLGSLDGIAAEKEDIVRGLRPGGLAVLNADDDRVAAMAEAAENVRLFGLTDGDVVAGDVRPGPGEVHFTLDSGVEVCLPVPGRHNVLNALAAVAVAREFGLADEDIAAALGRYKPLKMRLAREQLPGGVTLIDDCYNANLMSSKAALEILCEQPTGGRLVLVQGDMLELGAESEAMHEELGRAVAASKVRLLVTVGAATRALSLAASERTELMRFHFADSQAAAAEVPALLSSGDVALVKGSRGVALEHVVEAIRKAFGGLSR